MILVADIQQALREYCVLWFPFSRRGVLTGIDGTLVMQSQVANLHKLSERTVDAFSHWFNTPFPVLGGQSKHFLDAQDDLVALTAQEDSSPVSQLLRRYWPAKVSKDAFITNTWPDSGAKLFRESPRGTEHSASDASTRREPRLLPGSLPFSRPPISWLE
ncbi:hypothetical protein N657DRAFT_287459 [Parathielavia appendiculata]|uniref:Uncharacterized protein n=1 Tax=Parathielavia appendiculata TaxID=2587402 RepID=A0AAN6U3W7_9PEZI|nr:hypothetical protein N657DRAFT_287459 [Parathielavia appendiculata]